MAGRAERTALRRFLGKDGLEEQGITVTVPVYHPLVYDNFQGAADVTMTRKTDENGQELRGGPSTATSSISTITGRHRRSSSCSASWVPAASSCRRTRSFSGTGATDLASSAWARLS